MSRLFTIGVTALAILCFTPDVTQAHHRVPAERTAMQALSLLK